MKSLHRNLVRAIAASVDLTEHATLRGSQRLNLGPDALQRFAQRALALGLTHSQARGQLRRYLDGVFLAHGKADNLRVHGHFLFLFAGATLITVWALPVNLRRQAERNMARVHAEAGR